MRATIQASPCRTQAWSVPMPGFLAPLQRTSPLSRLPAARCNLELAFPSNFDPPWPPWRDGGILPSLFPSDVGPCLYGKAYGPSYLCQTKGARGAGVRPDQTGAGLPPVSAARSAQGAWRMGSGMHDPQPVDAPPGLLCLIGLRRYRQEGQYQQGKAALL